MNKIIWAVDPTQNPEDVKNLVKEMKVWAKHLNCSIQPVTIFSNRTFNFPFELEMSSKKKLEEVAEKSLSSYFKKVHINDILPADKIFMSSHSNRKMALELAKYAEKKKALLIFANTRAKKTRNPFRLGGFVETLVATSRTPVLLLNQDAVPSTRIRSILFPTDFEQDSKNALDHLAPWANAFNSKVLLYNQIETPVMYVNEFSGYWPESINPDLMMSDIEKIRQKKAAKISQVLTEKNVKVGHLIQRQKNALGVDILSAAKKNQVDLIALTNSSGPAIQSILGGVARDILLQAKCPVIVFYRPKALRKEIFKQKTQASKTYTSQKENDHAIAGVQH